MRINDFGQKIAQSHIDAKAPFWDDLYRQMFSDRFHRTELVLDEQRYQRVGIDRKVILTDGTTWHVEEKLRDKDYDDILLEYKSVLERDEPGWAVNDLYETDLLVYGIKPTGKFYVFQYPALRETAKARYDEWAYTFGFKDAPNHTYLTRNIPVPVQVLRALLLGKMWEYDVESAKPKRIGRWKPLTPFTGRQLEIATAAAEAGRLNAEYRKHVAKNGVGVINDACADWPPEPPYA